MRVKGGPATRNRRKKILKLAKGYYGAKHLLFRTAKEQVVKSLYYAFRDRKATKRNFRKLWIVRINAAANQCGITLILVLGICELNLCLSSLIKCLDVLKRCRSVRIPQ